MPSPIPALSLRSLRGLLCAALLISAGAVGRASDDHDHDHDRARKAREAGEVLPLRSVLERVQREHPGQVIDVELERDGAGGRWVYEIKLLRAGGALVKLKLDARDGTLITQRGRDRRRDAPPAPLAPPTPPKTPPASEAR